jgi:hypothetical protein
LVHKKKEKQGQIYTLELFLMHHVDSGFGTWEKKEENNVGCGCLIW